MSSTSVASRRLGRIAATAVFVNIAILSVWTGAPQASRPHLVHTPPFDAEVSQGSLISIDGEGRPQSVCPLKHTDVQVEVSGFLARTRVTQQFENPFPDKIEAVYTFPLPQRAAVDEMTLRVGDRVVKAKIKRREEAQAIYKAARAKGHVAGLLDQERPNIFTQSVANISPGEAVTVTISYVEALTYEAGTYELVFPMVVGPRYTPGTALGKLGGGWAWDTDQVPDASRMTPPVTPPGTRAGHDISLKVTLDTGLPLAKVYSPTHDVTVEQGSRSHAHVVLRNGATIPNKDFILKYDVAGGRIEDAILTHRNGQHGTTGFFTLILQPPERVTHDQVTPKELVFVLDTSGSMAGFPIEKAKETMKLALEGLHPQDTFNLITFAGNTRVLFPQPVPATRANLQKAQVFLKFRRGGGGTEMMQAIRTALEPSDSQKHVRIVCFMTDGYVGNDMAILAEVQKYPDARIFSFGIGSSVNRYLLDKMAEYGRGEVEFVGLQDDGSAAARRFHERVRSPLMTDISVEWGDLEVEDVYPKRLADLFSAKPLILTGRYSTPVKGVVEIHGLVAGRPVIRKITVDLPAAERRHDVLATLWARTKIADLMTQDLNGIQQGTARAEVREAITQVGLDYRLMTQFTSFVAVEEMTMTEGGEPRRIDVPVAMPEGVSYEGVFGWADAPARVGHRSRGRSQSFPKAAAKAPALGSSRSLGGMALEAFDEAESWVRQEDEQAQSVSLVSAKLHRSLAAIVERLKTKNSRPTAEEATFVTNGKAEIQVWLEDTSEETFERLEKLGFELLLEPRTGKLVIGRIALEKLAALAELKAVRYITPLMTGA